MGRLAAWRVYTHGRSEVHKIVRRYDSFGQLATPEEVAKQLGIPGVTDPCNCFRWSASVLYSRSLSTVTAPRLIDLFELSEQLHMDTKVLRNAAKLEWTLKVAQNELCPGIREDMSKVWSSWHKKSPSPSHNETTPCAKPPTPNNTALEMETCPLHNPQSPHHKAINLTY